MRVSDFTYELPEKLIAQYPPKVRGNSRLLVLNGQTKQLEHRKYKDFVDYLNPGDLVVLNDTRVIKARLIATNHKGQLREILLLEDHHNTDFNRRKAMYRGKLTAGETLKVGTAEIRIEQVFESGIAEVSSPINLLELSEQTGTVPLPPYMHRDANKDDIERYQTVFARNNGSVAAPTASLNFTADLHKRLATKSVSIAYLTLHVGLGTFLPIRSDEIEHHDMHSEYFEIPRSTIEAIQNTKKSDNRVFAVGTTVTRTLEYAANQISQFPPLLKDNPLTDWNNVSPAGLSGEADIFIYPGYEFKIVDGLLTNFHAPKSTVLMLAAAFAGWDNLKLAYDKAIKEKYAFLSYGDSMLII